MEKIKSRLTVFFEKPFWVGVYERTSGGRLSACKITFGAEPKDYEVYGFLLANWHSLSFSPPVKQQAIQKNKASPKRMQREIKKQLDSPGVGTKSQQALKLQQNEGKAARKKKSREQREMEEQRKFDLHRRRQKEKHRGR